MRIEIDECALAALARIPEPIKGRIRSKIERFAADPKGLANQVTRLRGRPYLRLRVGDYRVIFEVARDIVQVRAIGHRREVYE